MEKNAIRIRVFIKEVKLSDVGYAQVFPILKKNLLNLLPIVNLLFMRFPSIQIVSIELQSGFLPIAYLINCQHFLELVLFMSNCFL